MFSNMYVIRLVVYVIRTLWQNLLTVITNRPKRSNTYER